MQLQAVLHSSVACILSTIIVTGCLSTDDDLADALGSMRAPLIGPQDAIPNEYIVVFKDSVGVQGVSNTINQILLSSSKSKIHSQFTVIPGFSARLSTQDLDILRSNPSIKYVERNGLVEVLEAEVAQADGIDRIDQRNLPRDGQYNDYNFDGFGITAYVIDTGIRSTHNEFAGRVVDTVEFVGDGRTEDCHGHGTHVASTIAGTQFGVADGVNVFSVRVLNCDGSGSFASVIEGINFVAQDCSGDCVANMSLGGNFSQALNDAVENAVAAGVPFAVSSGDSRTNSCDFSPASASSALTVDAAADNDDAAFFTNKGVCSDIFAPGVSILGADIGNENDSQTISGTSMASAHVTGVIAQALQCNPGASPATIENMIKTAATPGIIGNPGGSPNLMLFNDVCGGWPPPPPPPPPAPGDSCVGHCGDFDLSRSCQCDDACVYYNDCCFDFGSVCSEPPAPPVNEYSCLQSNSCGGQAPGGCYCDNICIQYNDCCYDGPC